jgi:hypothetical protein
MVQYNFAPPAIDFSPLGRLGETYDRSVKRTRDAEVAANRERALAGFGQNGDLAALGTTLLRAGDLEGGMQALRLDAAQKGSPFQRERAAAEDARYEQQRADQQAERDRQEAARQRDDARQDRLQPYTGTDEFKDPRSGLRDPVTGDIFWQDGTVTPGPKRPPGLRSGGAGDPNLPPLGGVPAQSMVPAGTNPPDYGYVLPGASGGQYQPMGTVRMPKPDVVPPQGNAAVAAPPPAALPIAPPAEAGPTAIAAPPAPQASQTAASGTAPPVQGAPLTATQINQGTSNIAPMTNAEMIAEAHRIGISPGQYRAARAAAIQKEMIAKSGGPDPEKNLGEQAGRLAVAETYLANAPKIREAIANGEQTGFWDRTMGVNKIGEQGHVQNQIESGVDALVHMMTGAGMSESEARRKVGRYEPALLDTSTSLLAKHDQLVTELKHWRELAYRGKGAAGALPEPSPAYGAGSNSITLDNGIKATW